MRRSEEEVELTFGDEPERAPAPARLVAAMTGAAEAPAEDAAPVGAAVEPTASAESSETSELAEQREQEPAE